MGFKEPPESEQFKKGTSGNPKGRPRGSKSWSAVLRKSLKVKVEAEDPNKPGVKKMMPLGEAIGLAQIRQALKGNTKAYNAIMDRAEGKVVQPLAHGGIDGAPLQVPTIIVEGVDGIPDPEGRDE